MGFFRLPDLLAKERTIAGAGFNRWLVPPAALAIHLCIGMAYGFSVFWKPLGSALLGPDGAPLPSCAAGAASFGDKLAGTARALFATDCNWTQFDLGWMYTLFLWCSDALQRSGVAGLSALVLARPASCRPCAGAVAC